MIIEGKFLDLNLKKNRIDNYHYFDSLEILCNKFVINQLKVDLNIYSMIMWQT